MFSWQSLVSRYSILPFPPSKENVVKYYERDKSTILQYVVVCGFWGKLITSVIGKFFETKSPMNGTTSAIIDSENYCLNKNENPCCSPLLFLCLKLISSIPPFPLMTATRVLTYHSTLLFKCRNSTKHTHTGKTLKIALFSFQAENTLLEW